MQIICHFRPILQQRRPISLFADIIKQVSSFAIMLHLKLLFHSKYEDLFERIFYDFCVHKTNYLILGAICLNWSKHLLQSKEQIIRTVRTNKLECESRRVEVGRSVALRPQKP